MRKVVNIETAPGKFVPTLVDVPDEMAVVEEKKPKAKKKTKKAKKE